MARGKPKAQKHTREKILDAAEDLFAEKGFDAASLSDIADQVGIRQPGIFKHFATKKDLYFAVVTRIMDPWFEMLSTFAEDVSSREKAQLLLNEWVTYQAQHPNLARLIQQATLVGGWQLELLADKWFGQLVDRERDLELSREDYWQHNSEMTPWIVMALHNMMLGYVTMAPLYQRLFGFDPLSKDAIEKQSEFYFSFCERGLVKPEFHGRDRPK